MYECYILGRCYSSNYISTLIELAKSATFDRVTPINVYVGYRCVGKIVNCVFIAYHDSLT